MFGDGIPDHDLIGSKWERRSPQGDSMDHVEISGIFDTGDTSELVIRTADGIGFPTGEYEHRTRSDRDGKALPPEKVERLVNARTATADSFLAAYTRMRDPDEIDRAAEKFRAISERLAALEGAN